MHLGLVLISGTLWSILRALCRRDAQQWPDIGMDVMLDVSVTRMATFTRVYDAVTFPLLIRVPLPCSLHLWHNVVCFPRLMSP